MCGREGNRSVCAARMKDEAGITPVRGAAVPGGRFMMVLEGTVLFFDQVIQCRGEELEISADTRSESLVAVVVQSMDNERVGVRP